MNDQEEIFVVGAGGHADVCVDILSLRGLTIAGYIAEVPPADHKSSKYLGTLKNVLSSRSATGSAVVAVGDNRSRLKIGKDLLARGWNLPPVIHPSAVIAESAIVGAGAVICAGSVVGPYAMVGTLSIINTSASVDHHCRIGEGSHVGPGANLCGAVSLGQGVFLGAASVCIPNTSVGDAATVGAGSVVIRTVPPGETWVGNPAKPANHK